MPNPTPFTRDATVYALHGVQEYLGSGPRKAHHLHGVSCDSFVRDETRRITVLCTCRGPKVLDLEKPKQEQRAIRYDDNTLGSREK